MWSWLKRNARPEAPSPEAPPDSVEELQRRTSELCRAADSIPADRIRKMTEALFTSVQRKLAQVELDAGDYPASGIRGDVWMDGASLAPVAGQLAVCLQAHGLTDLEWWAHIFRCRAVLAVQSHYHHIVGPAMLARADCEVRLGRSDAALKSYGAVIADLSFLLDEYEEHGDAPMHEDREALECLLRAVVAHGDLGAPMESLRARLGVVLDREPEEEEAGQRTVPD